jgi:pimeloyl-ACP methyl ester carboxylesterase
MVIQEVTVDLEIPSAQGPIEGYVGDDSVVGLAQPDTPCVIAFHCSGGVGRQWRKLRNHLPPEYRLLAPDMIGTASMGHWSGQHAFRLADEARPIIELIDRHPGPIHLVGHSYGGGVALHVAAARPDRVAGLALYEPSAFHLLALFGDHGRAGRDEILGVISRLRERLASGAYHEAATGFVDYWNGEGAFAALNPEYQADLLRYLPKSSLDFHALLEETTPMDAYQAIKAPALILRGEHAPTPTRTIADALLFLLPDATQIVVEGAGHMGPISHAEIVAQAIAQWTCRSGRQGSVIPLAERRQPDIAAPARNSAVSVKNRSRPGSPSSGM